MNSLRELTDLPQVAGGRGWQPLPLRLKLLEIGSCRSVGLKGECGAAGPGAGLVDGQAKKLTFFGSKM